MKGALSGRIHTVAPLGAIGESTHETVAAHAGDDGGKKNNSTRTWARTEKEENAANGNVRQKADSEMLSVVESSVATLHLSQSLLACLQSRPFLDAVTKKSLVDVKFEIEMALTSSMGSRDETYNNSQLKPSTNSGSEKASAAGSHLMTAVTRYLPHLPQQILPQSTPKPYSVSGSYDKETSLMKRKLAIDDQKSAATIMEAAAEALGARRKRKKKRALVAVYPFLELNEQQSQQSVMQRITGDGLSELFWRHKNLIYRLTWLAGGISCSGIILVFINVSEWSAPVAHAMSEETFLTISALGYSLGIAHYMIYCFWLMNFQLVKQLIRQLEAFLFVLELTFACLSLWGLLCFQPYGLILCMNYFIFFTCFICYDSLPIAFRAARRKENFLLLLIWVMQMGLIYAKTSNRICYYRVSLTRGLSLEEPNADTERDCSNSCSSSISASSSYAPAQGISSDAKTARWFAASSNDALSFSLFDFFLNRAFTLLVYMAKLLYFSFQRPEDCVVIRSRVRLVEIPLRGDEPPMLSQQSQ